MLFSIALALPSAGLARVDLPGVVVIATLLTRLDIGKQASISNDTHIFGASGPLLFCANCFNDLAPWTMEALNIQAGAPDPARLGPAGQGLRRMQSFVRHLNRCAVNWTVSKTNLKRTGVRHDGIAAHSTLALP